MVMVDDVSILTTTTAIIIAKHLPTAQRKLVATGRFVYVVPG
jgi:hypothetical protein